MPAGTKLTADVARATSSWRDVDLKTFRVGTRRPTSGSAPIIDAASEREGASVEEKAEERIDKILQPDELPPGVIQLVKVYLAEKRKISVGDKMAGRHGNKGIVARIVPEEDMPFLPDGTPGGHRAQPARRAEPHERGADPRDPPRLGRADPRLRGQDAGVPGRERGARSACCSAWPGSAGRRRALRLRRAAAATDARGDHPDGAGPQEGRAGGRARHRCAEAGARDARRAGGTSAETQELFQQVRDVPDGRPRRSWRERELRPASAGGGVPPGPGRARRQRRDAKADAKAAQGAGEGGAASRRPRRWRPRASRRWPALLGRKDEADVDAAADELLRRAGLTPAGKVRLRDGRTGESFEGDGHGRRDLHAQAVAPGGRQDPRAVASDRTRWSRSSRSPARRSSAASGSERWKCGRWRRTAPRTCCRRS